MAAPVLDNLANLDLDEWTQWCGETTNAFQQDLCTLQMTYSLNNRMAEVLEEDTESELEPNSLYRLQLTTFQEHRVWVAGNDQIPDDDVRTWNVMADRGRAYLLICTRRDIIRIRCGQMPNTPQTCLQFWQQPPHEHKWTLVFIIAVIANDPPALFPIPIRLQRPIVVVTLRDTPVRVYILQTQVNTQADLEGQVTRRICSGRFSVYRILHAGGNEFEFVPPHDEEVRYIDLNYFVPADPEQMEEEEQDEQIQDQPGDQIMNAAVQALLADVPDQEQQEEFQQEEEVPPLDPLEAELMHVAQEADVPPPDEGNLEDQLIAAAMAAEAAQVNEPIAEHDVNIDVQEEVDPLEAELLAAAQAAQQHQHNPDMQQ